MGRFTQVIGRPFDVLVFEANYRRDEWKLRNNASQWLLLLIFP
jgi:hypothetical protein